MKIVETSSNKASKNRKISLKNISKASISSSEKSFFNIMNEENELNFDEKIAVLLKNIDEQGDKVIKRLDIKEVIAYKNMISEFLNEITQNSHKYVKKNVFDRKGRHKVLAIIKNINQEIDALTKDVLEKEKNSLIILNRINDIKGLIIDLIL